MALSGKQFKEQYPGSYYKFLRADLTHYGFTYKLGLNIDTKKFTPSGNCKEGGLYFFNDLKFADRFYMYGPKLGVVEIPDDALVYVENTKFKADKLFLREITESEDKIIKLFKQSIDNGMSLPPPIVLCSNAALHGHLEVLKWARENNYSWDELTCEYAALNGHLDVLKWARKNGCRWSEETCISAARNGHLEILKWARGNRCHSSNLIENQSDLRVHQASCIECKKLQCPWNIWVCEYATANNHPEVFKWAVENGCQDYDIGV